MKQGLKIKRIIQIKIIKLKEKNERDQEARIKYIPTLRKGRVERTCSKMRPRTVPHQHRYLPPSL